MRHDYHLQLKRHWGMGRLPEDLLDWVVDINDLHNVFRSRFAGTLQDEILASTVSQRWFVGTWIAVMLHVR